MRIGSETWRRLDQRDFSRHTANYQNRFETPFVVNVRQSLWRLAVATLMVVVMYFAPVVAQLDEAAHATPIVDPHAPITFQPTVTQSSGGTPVINITAPNANGLSVSQFQSLSIGSEGLIFKNSLVSGTSLNGGQVGANANLVAAGRTASTILAEVTSTGTQYASVINGPVEFFGNTAALIISNPSGISIPGGTADEHLNVSAQGPLSVTETGGDATLSGAAVTPGTLAVQSGGTTTLGDQTQAATANVSGGNVGVDGALTTTGDATLAATSGNLSGTGAIGTTQGNVNLSAS
ncbi:two-partner secretion domain-containing protein [Paraburkholderia heleia]|uniref:two-partner secretion domain-containing protein n=1 Tax=Paraburkholderia heleia TaxID=634127 RepID=UPI002AB7833F|nr:hypothetical protein [Paraburkholderia heleia]